MPKDSTTTKFKVDISELKAAMQEAKRAVAVANSEFQAVSSSMDDWAKSSDGLEAKLKQLNTNLDSQKTMLKILEEQYDLTVKQMGEGSAAADDLRIKINKQKADINNTSKEIGKYELSLQNVVAAQKEAEEAAENLSEAMEKAKDKERFSELNSIIEETKRAIEIADSEFKAISASMDDWTKSANGLKAKLKQLDSNLNDQKAILDSLEQQYELTVKEMGEGSAAADKLKIAINKQKAVVNGTKKEISKYESSLQEISEAEKKAEKAGENLAETLDDVGDKAKGAGDGFSVFKGAIATFAGNALTGLVDGLKNAVSSFIGLADETREYRTEIGKLEAAFSSSGHSSEAANKAYQELQSIIGETDQSVEAAQQIALLAESEEDVAKWSGVAAGVVGKFGDALQPETFYESANETLKLGEATGAYTQMLEGCGMSVEDFNAGLEKCKTEAEKQAYMLSVTEKALGSAGEEYRKNNAEIIKANEANEAMAESLAGIGGAAEPVISSVKLIGASFLKTLLPAVGDLAGGFTDLINGVEGAEKDIGKAIGGIVDTILGKLTDILPKIAEVGVSLISELAGSLLDSLPKLVNALFEIVNELLASLGEILPKIVLKIIEIVPKLIDALMENLPTFLQACIDFLMAIVRALPTVIAAILDALPDLITSIIDGLVAGIDVLLDGALQLFMAIVDAIPLIIPKLIEALPKIIDSLINGLLGAIPQLIQGAVQLLMALVQAIPQFLPYLIEAIPQIITTVITALLNNVPALVDGAVQTFMALVEAIPTICIEIVKAAPQIIWSLIEGLMSAVGQLWDAVCDIGQSIVDGFCSFFGINSPSKVMEEQGEYLVQGVANGLSEMPGEVNDSISETVDDVAQWGNDMVAKGKEAATNFINATSQVLQQLPQKVWTWLQNTLAKIDNWKTSIVAKGKLAFTNFVTAVVDNVKTMPQKVWTWLQNTLAKVQSWGTGLAAKGKQAATELVNAVVNKVGDLPEKMLSIGSSIVEGLWNGISASTQWLKNKISGWVGDVETFLKNLFEINSPSKMTERIGKWLPEGLAVGIDKNAKSAIASMKEMALNTVGAAKDGVRGITSVAAASPGVAGGGVINNFYQTINSPKQLSRLDIYRNSKNLLGYAGGGK